MAPSDAVLVSNQLMYVRSQKCHKRWFLDNPVSSMEIHDEAVAEEAA
jgi:hypothetical protein